MSIILTNCTNRKRGETDSLLFASSLEVSSVKNVADQWKQRLRQSQSSLPAREIYCGRSFREAETSADITNSALYVVSAGLGIVESNCKIPVYDLTISSGSENSILEKIKNTDSRGWWAQVSNKNPYGNSFNEILERNPKELVLVALSSPYVTLIINEITKLDKRERSRLRFFGKNTDKYLPDDLKKYWMPYDSRLENIKKGYSGTQTDFAQRSLRHFIENILTNGNHKKSHISHCELVEYSLSKIKEKKIIQGQKMTDCEIKSIINDLWDYGDGKSSALLKILRHEYRIACEQSRFRTIYHSVKNHRG